MMRRPPDFARQPATARPERFNNGGKQKGLSDSDDLRPETLLRRLRPKGGEVGWNHVAGNDFAIRCFERGDLGREVVVHHLITAGIDQLVPRLGKCRGQSELRVTPRIAVSIVREEATNYLITRRRIPQCQERANDVFKTPEE